MPTVRLTLPPLPSFLPGCGLWATTWFFFFALDGLLVTRPIRQCAFRILVFAFATVLPTTFGTAQGGLNGGGGGGGGGGARRASREMLTATCSECGQEAQVPFQPSADKPVYCSTCFEKRRGAADRSGGGRYGGRSRY